MSNYNTEELLTSTLKSKFIPKRFWDYDREKVKFNEFAIQEDAETKRKISGKVQKKYYDDFIQALQAPSEENNILNYSNSLWCFSGVPTEEPAQAAAFYAALSALKYDVSFDVSCVNLAYKLESVKLKTPKILLLYNVTADSDRERIQQTRDWISWARDEKDSCCIVATAGCDPVVFCETKLRMTPDYAFYTTSQSTIAKFF